MEGTQPYLSDRGKCKLEGEWWREVDDILLLFLLLEAFVLEGRAAVLRHQAVHGVAVSLEGAKVY